MIGKGGVRAGIACRTDVFERRAIFGQLAPDIGGQTVRRNEEEARDFRGVLLFGTSDVEFEIYSHWTVYSFGCERRAEAWALNTHLRIKKLWIHVPAISCSCLETQEKPARSNTRRASSLASE